LDYSGVLHVIKIKLGVAALVINDRICVYIYGDSLARLCFGHCTTLAANNDLYK